MYRKLVWTALALWVVAMTALGGVLLLGHQALPTPPPSDPQLQAAVAAALPAPHWRAVHVMYRSCPCSRRTIDHLVARRPRPGVDELVVMVDDDAIPGREDGRLAAAGFAVRVISRAVLARDFHLEAAPVLVVAQPDGALAYIGGYNRHKQSATFEDVAILDDLVLRHAALALPVFGCPTSARLAAAVDPLGLTHGKASR